MENWIPTAINPCFFSKAKPTDKPIVAFQPWDCGWRCATHTKKKGPRNPAQALVELHCHTPRGERPKVSAGLELELWGRSERALWDSGGWGISDMAITTFPFPCGARRITRTRERNRQDSTARSSQNKIWKMTKKKRKRGLPRLDPDIKHGPSHRLSWPRLRIPAWPPRGWWLLSSGAAAPDRCRFVAVGDLLAAYLGYVR